ncbi:MAG: tRNA guanosine(34) transglycosylase Tgt [Proteobacteria bacterium]|nr:tRNA guanosine(34) transglycosylase Tgt [Pseudomonadota bacterium]
MFDFTIHSRAGAARHATLATPHGDIETPVFMPVGTRAAMRAMTPAQIEDTGSQIILANTYHCALQPGADIVARCGGLHKFMNWNKPILTDSGGFQVFSLPKTVTEEGVTFKWKKGGKPFTMTPESSIQLQQKLGADIIMAFDECVAWPCERPYAEASVERTTRWEKRCLEAKTREDQALFGIIQGAFWKDLREKSAADLVPLDFPGYAIGGLSVGEGLEMMDKVLGWTTHLLPESKPRYLMGVGLPEDLWCGVSHGIDMFDCVIPTRHARGALLYTFKGKLRVSNKRFRKDRLAPDTTCPCYTCQNFSRAYLHHLFTADEVLGTTLAAIHNVTFLQELTKVMRTAIDEDRFEEARAEFFADYGSS